MSDGTRDMVDAAFDRIWTVGFQAWQRRPNGPDSARFFDAMQRVTKDELTAAWDAGHAAGLERAAKVVEEYDRIPSATFEDKYGTDNVAAAIRALSPEPPKGEERT
jgi:hypothetical protein